MSNDRKATLRAVLDQPFVGFTPWILLSVVEGPHRVVLASALACALAILLVTSGAIAGMAPKLLDLTALAFFGALTVMAAVTSAGTQRWLGVWSAEVSNAAIAVITVGSIAAAKPFTLAYARETTEPEYWDSPLFRRINYVISAVWAVVFLLIAIVGYIGAPTRQCLDQLDHPDRARDPRDQVHALVPRPRRHQAGPGFRWRLHPHGSDPRATPAAGCLPHPSRNPRADHQRPPVVDRRLTDRARHPHQQIPRPIR